MKDGLTEAEATEWIATGNDRWREEHLPVAIVGADDDRLLGEVGLNVNPRHVSGEAHYWVGTSERGRGVATTALSLIIDWGFSKGIERIFLLIHPENAGSKRVAGKLRFTKGYCGPTNPSRPAAPTSYRGLTYQMIFGPGNSTNATGRFHKGAKPS